MRNVFASGSPKFSSVFFSSSDALAALDLPLHVYSGNNIYSVTVADGEGYSYTPIPDPAGNAPYDVTAAQMLSPYIFPNSGLLLVADSLDLGGELTKTGGIFHTPPDVVDPNATLVLEYESSPGNWSEVPGDPDAITAQMQGHDNRLNLTINPIGYPAITAYSNTISVPAAGPMWALVEDLSDSSDMSTIGSTTIGAYAAGTDTRLIEYGGGSHVSKPVDLVNGETYRFSADPTDYIDAPFNNGRLRARLANNSGLSGVLIDTVADAAFSIEYTHAGATGAYHFGVQGYVGGGPYSIGLVGFKVERQT